MIKWQLNSHYISLEITDGDCFTFQYEGDPSHIVNFIKFPFYIQALVDPDEWWLSICSYIQPFTLYHDFSLVNNKIISSLLYVYKLRNHCRQFRLLHDKDILGYCELLVSTRQANV